MTKSVNGRFGDYSILPKVIQMLLQLGFELVESDLLWVFFYDYFCSYKNESLLVQQTRIIGKKKRGISIIVVVCKEKAAEYYVANKNILKEKTKNKYKNFSEEEKK